MNPPVSAGMSAGISTPAHPIVTTTLALVALLLVVPFTCRLRRWARRAALIRSTRRQLRANDVRYRPSVAEVAAMSGSTLAEARQRWSAAPVAPPAVLRRQALVATIVARRPGRPRSRLLFDALVGSSIPAA